MKKFELISPIEIAPIEILFIPHGSSLILKNKNCRPVSCLMKYIIIIIIIFFAWMAYMQGRTGHSGNETLVAVAFSISHTKCQKRGLLDFFCMECRRDLFIRRKGLLTSIHLCIDGGVSVSKFKNNVIQK
jgi:hypothetical protein